jgi:ATP-dependent DNA helicase RecG
VYVRELVDSVDTIRGIGPRNRELFAQAGIHTVADLLLYLPRDYEDRSVIHKLSEALSLPRATCLVRVVAHDTVGWGRRRTLKVYVEDSSARAALVCFNRNFLERVLVPGRTFVVTGVFRFKFQEIQSASFDVEPWDADTPAATARILPIYPLTEGLLQPTVRRAMQAAVEAHAGGIDEELPRNLREAAGFPPLREALAEAHFPTSAQALARARAALVYWELFYLQLVIKRRGLKRRVETRKARAPAGHDLRDRLLARLPFRLTADQETVLQEIERDLFSDRPMARLIQGDVGCGKTLVAVISALAVIEAGGQAALMAPTELLARQHADNIARLLEPLGVNVGLLTGSVRSEQRARLLAALATGEVQLVVGTHALFSEDVAYKALGLVVVDEQHRFGVEQRLALVAKGANPDLLLMTATPIPRTLALTAFGDLDISTIRTMPEGRRPVITHLAREGNEDKVYERVRRELDAGRQAYFVYPMIEESQRIDLKHAEGMYELLSTRVFPGRRLALIHSRVPEEDKRARMEQFTRGETHVLVATSVVEVGVDVANATCMVIEHAERFGLSALHQLRGRVGRGPLQSLAFLVYGEALTEDGIARLKTMKETTDGFRIAEEDLRIRGPGELLGVRQSGWLRLAIADLVRDADVLLRARDDVAALLAADPGLISEGNRPVREVLARAAPFRDETLDGG